MFGVENDTTVQSWKPDRVLVQIKELNDKELEKQKTRLRGAVSTFDQEEEQGDKNLKSSDDLVKDELAEGDRFNRKLEPSLKSALHPHERWVWDVNTRTLLIQPPCGGALRDYQPCLVY